MEKEISEVFEEFENQLSEEERLSSHIEQARIIGEQSNVKFQSTTASETTFRAHLINQLKKEGLSCEVAQGAELIIPLFGLNFREINPEIRERLLRKRRKFSKRMPDFTITKYGLAIEIDGSVHNREDRIRADETREHEYALLGLRLMVISNDDVHNINRVSSIVGNIIKMFREVERSPNFEKERRLVRKRIHDARRRYDEFQRSSYKPRIKQTELPGGFPATRKRNGWSIIVR